jgi:hypothetical protein
MPGIKSGRGELRTQCGKEDILATFQDAERLEEIVTAVLGGSEVAPDHEREYREMLQRLFTENDEEIASRATTLHLPPTLEQLAAETRSKRDNMLTYTSFAEGIKRIKEILVARSRQDIRNIDIIGTEGGSARSVVNSSEWTGASTPRERLVAVKALIPVAQGAVEQLIAALEDNQHNGGPPLDDRHAALAALRNLHATLGQLLLIADDGALDREYNGGLVDEAVRYAKRAIRSLKHDPLPYATAATILAIMCACGFPSAGAFLADVAFNVRRPKT